MEPQWNLWLHLFRVEHFAKKAGERGVWRAVHAGSCTLQVDDSPADKGKQEADVETAEASDRAGTSAALGGDQAEALARWPDFAGLALVRAEEELPR
jgi:hypothetical protein